MFLGRTHLKFGDYRTLLNLVAITCDNGVIPIAHMLQKSGEKKKKKKKNTTLFLRLVKKYIALEWDKIEKICDQLLSLEKGIYHAFSKHALTRSIHLYKCVVKHKSKGTYTPFFTMMSSLDEKVKKDANDSSNKNW